MRLCCEYINGWRGNIYREHAVHGRNSELDSPYFRCNLWTRSERCPSAATLSSQRSDRLASHGPGYARMPCGSTMYGTTCARMTRESRRAIQEERPIENSCSMIDMRGSDGWMLGRLGSIYTSGWKQKSSGDRSAHPLAPHTLWVIGLRLQQMVIGRQRALY